MSKPAADLLSASIHPAGPCLQIAGQSAWSAFRAGKLLERLQQSEPRITGLASRFLYLADLNVALAGADRERLDALLLSGEAVQSLPNDGAMFCVVPRMGTISPWSTKATDIAHACGLTQVRRLERGIQYALSVQGSLSQP